MFGRKGKKLKFELDEFDFFSIDSETPTDDSDEDFDPESFVDFPGVEEENWEFHTKKVNKKKKKPIENYDVYLKAAKSRDDLYTSGSFPASLLCSPYKYHMKIIGNLQQKDLKLSLVFANSNASPKSAKTPIVVDEIITVSPRESIVKFALFICSFHFKRKEFQLVVSSKSGERIWKSTPFRTYARRRTPKPKPENGIQKPLKQPLYQQPQPNIMMVPPQQMTYNPFPYYTYFVVYPNQNGQAQRGNQNQYVGPTYFPVNLNMMNMNNMMMNQMQLGNNLTNMNMNMNMNFNNSTPLKL